MKLKKIRIDNNENGSIMLYTVLVLIAIMTISIAMVKLFLPKFVIVREAVNSAVAIYAADTGMEWCIFTNRVNPASLPAIPGQLVTLNTITGVTIQYYTPDVSDCPYNGTVGFRIVGTYRGISRSLEVF